MQKKQNKQASLYKKKSKNCAGTLWYSSTVGQDHWVS